MTVYIRKGQKLSITNDGEVSSESSYFEDFFQQMLNDFVNLNYSPEMGNINGAFYEHTLKEIGFVIESQGQEEETDVVY